MVLSSGCVGNAVEAKGSRHSSLQTPIPRKHEREGTWRNLVLASHEPYESKYTIHVVVYNPGNLL